MKEIIEKVESMKKEIADNKISKAQKEGKLEGEMKNLKDNSGVGSEDEAKELLEDKKKQLDKVQKKIKARYEDLVEEWDEN